MIDTVVYRGGDALSGWLVTALGELGLGLPALSFVAVPLAAAWLGIALWLGRKEEIMRGGKFEC